jgi:hypothetical protein
MKRKIFIGSSREGLLVAEEVKSAINSMLGDWIECEIWSDGKIFSSNQSTLECLVKASRKYDYGILVASKDDYLLKRLQFKKSMRDNVLFEMGLFLGSLGLQRAYLFTHDKVSLPTDYNGITVIKYNRMSKSQKIIEIIHEIERTKESFNLKPMPSAALALGYFENFVLPFARKYQKQLPGFNFKILIPVCISDLPIQIKKYKIENPSKKTKGGRPIAYKYNDTESKFWDMPTTLKTIDLLINYFIQDSELGINKEKEDWIQHELRNFKGTLEMLIKKYGVFKDKIVVEYL